MSDAIAVIAAYIPSETLGGYIAASALLQPKGNGALWGVFLGAVAVTVFLVWYYFTRGQQASPSSRSSKVRTFSLLVILSIVSFTVWAAAVPGSPFSEWSADATRFAAVAALVLAIILPKVAEVLNIAPPWLPASPA